MTMIQAICAEDASHVNFQPVAEIAVAPAWFKEKGIEFHPDADDLDQYGFAPFWLDDKPFALMHCMNGPSESVSLLAGDVGGGEVGVAAYASAVAEALGVSPSLFRGERMASVFRSPASALPRRRPDAFLANAPAPLTAHGGTTDPVASPIACIYT